jgi:hypothetical protein
MSFLSKIYRVSALTTALGLVGMMALAATSDEGSTQFLWGIGCAVLFLISGPTLIITRLCGGE